MAASHKIVNGSLQNCRGYWHVRARVYDPASGRSKHRAKSTGFRVADNTKRKAQQAMKEILSEWEQEANTTAAKTEPLFSDYVDGWIKRKTATVRPNTVKSYQDYATVHILPALGHFEVRSMRLQNLQDYYAQKRESLSMNSLKKHHVVISGALLDAVRDGIIEANFADYVEFPKAKKFVGKAYTAEQVAQLLTAAESEGEPARAAIILSVCYGLRRSEICGLRWKDIDFESGRLHVVNTITRNGALVIEGEQTKTTKSKRTIGLVESTIPYLQELKQSQVKNQLKLDKVCRWPNGKTVTPDYITRKVSHIMKKYGLEHIRLHDLRHTAASLLSGKASLKQVQEFLGHEDITTTANIYTHVYDEELDVTSRAMDDILKTSVFCTAKCTASEVDKSVGQGN